MSSSYSEEDRKKLNSLYEKLRPDCFGIVKEIVDLEIKAEKECGQ